MFQIIEKHDHYRLIKVYDVFGIFKVPITWDAAMKYDVNCHIKVANWHINYIN